VREPNQRSLACRWPSACAKLYVQRRGGGTLRVLPHARLEPSSASAPAGAAMLR